MLNKNYEYFLTITECKSISKAAEKLFISQPSLSQHLSRLETELGAKLFDRSKSPLKLTFAGERYNAYLTQMIEMEKKMTDEFEEIKNETFGKISIGINTQRGAFMLPEIIPKFLEECPSAKIKINEGSSDYLESLIMKDKIDICFLNLTTYSNHFTYEHVMYEKIVLVANKQHPIVNGVERSLENMTSIDINLLKDAQFVSLHSDQNLSVIVNSLFGKYNLKQNIALRTINLTTAINLVAATPNYFTLVPETYASHATNSENLLFFMVDNPTLIWPLNLVYKKSKYLSRTALKFIDCAKRCFYDKHISPNEEPIPQTYTNFASSRHVPEDIKKEFTKNGPYF